MSKRTRKLLSLGIAIMSISMSSLSIQAAPQEQETETETTVESSDPTLSTLAEENPEQPSNDEPASESESELEEPPSDLNSSAPIEQVEPSSETKEPVSESVTPPAETELPQTEVAPVEEPQTSAPESFTEVPSETVSESPQTEVATEQPTEAQTQATESTSSGEPQFVLNDDPSSAGDELTVDDEDMNLSFVDLDPSLFTEDDMSTLLEDDDYVAPDLSLHSISSGSEVKVNINGFNVDPSKYPAANINQNTKEIYSYLVKEMGLNHAAACGVLANIHLESNFNPLALGDGGTSYGICQWHNERFNRLISYCNSNGYDYNTIDGQLHYLQSELESSYPNVIGYIRQVENSAKGSYDAAYYWCVYFESPSDTIARAQQRGYLAMNNYFGSSFMTADVLEKNSQIVQDIREQMEKSKDGKEALKRIRAEMSNQS